MWWSERDLAIAAVQFVAVILGAGILLGAGCTAGGSWLWQNVDVSVSVGMKGEE